MKKFVLGLATVAVMASCGAVGNTAKVGTQQVSINGSQWTLSDPVQGKTPTLVIENGKISGNAGCNNYFGTLSLDASGGNFSATNIGSTRMMCENIPTETRFLKTLEQADKYVVNGDKLELYKGNLLLLKFVKL